MRIFFGNNVFDPNMLGNLENNYFLMLTKLGYLQYLFSKTIFFKEFLIPPKKMFFSYPGMTDDLV